MTQQGWHCVSVPRTVTFGQLGTSEVCTPSTVRVHCRSCTKSIPARGNYMESLKNQEKPYQKKNSAASVVSEQQKVSKETADHGPRFLLIKRIEGDFVRISPFLIAKALYGLIGETKSVKKVRDGLLIETVSNAQSQRLLKVERFIDYPVEVIPHSTLNYSKGVVYCPDLLNCTEEEITEGLKDKGVINVQRIKSKRDGTLSDTPNHIFTFNSPKLPTTIKVAFYSLPVRPYIPAPMRCFRCQLFGHTAVRCNSNQVCVCGQPLHEGSPCQTPIKCINCDGEHSARSKSCPKYKQELAIQKIKITEKITYAEAKKKVIIPTPSTGISYAQASQSLSQAKVNVQNVVTEITPVIVDIIKSTLEKSLQTWNFAPETTRPRSVSLSSTVTSERTTFLPPSTPISQDKRKRHDESQPEDLSSGEDRDSGASGTVMDTTGDRKQKKKKPGWPKGRPRSLNPTS